MTTEWKLLSVLPHGLTAGCDWRGALLHLHFKREHSVESEYRS